MISYRIKGNPYANITWYKNGKKIEIDDKTFVGYRFPNRLAILDGSLEIHKDTQANSGNYTLVATNIYGSVQKSINVSFNQGNLDRGGHDH